MSWDLRMEFRDNSDPMTVSWLLRGTGSAGDFSRLRNSPLEIFTLSSGDQGYSENNFSESIEILGV
jgi:hypothetical protein